jgi:hypothetical protein
MGGSDIGCLPNARESCFFWRLVKTSVADPDPFDPDPDHAVKFDNDPDPAFQFDTIPNPTV